MARDSKRFTICVPLELSHDLTAAKHGAYQNCTQTDMLRDLIARGLREIEKRSHEVS